MVWVRRPVERRTDIISLRYGRLTLTPRCPFLDILIVCKFLHGSVVHASIAYSREDVVHGCQIVILCGQIDFGKKNVLLIFLCALLIYLQKELDSYLLWFVYNRS